MSRIVEEYNGFDELRPAIQQELISYYDKIKVLADKLDYKIFNSYINPNNQFYNLNFSNSKFYISFNINEQEKNKILLRCGQIGYRSIGRIFELTGDIETDLKSVQDIIYNWNNLID